MESSLSSNLLWLDSSTSKAPSDSSKQRREVMQKVALRRKREPKQRHPNSTQLPVFVHNDASGSSGGRLGDQGSSSQSGNPEPASFDSSDLELPQRLTPFGDGAMHPSVFVESNLDFVDLASLASLEVGRYMGQGILINPRSIACFLGGTTWSYCRYVPSNTPAVSSYALLLAA
jgi:hypothetical protein